MDLCCEIVKHHQKIIDGERLCFSHTSKSYFVSQSSGTSDQLYKLPHIITGLIYEPVLTSSSKVSTVDSILSSDKTSCDSHVPKTLGAAKVEIVSRYGIGHSGELTSPVLFAAWHQIGQLSLPGVHAKITKLADIYSNIVMTTRHWEQARKLFYFKWCDQVFEIFKSANPILY
ncbi:hypothetical protein [Alteromonas sp. R78001]|uniref:hypothetical protein n=1 Tax=Alteromonas sp. R78001 TaxID=3093865 RepID=UPI00366FB390